MAAILIIFTFIISQLLDQVLNMNLDQFLHQQSDNFQSTISIENNQVSFHEINKDIRHSQSTYDEIPYYLQMLDRLGGTGMFAGNLEGRRLYYGATLPKEEV
jgi:hypothetical protein